MKARRRAALDDCQRLRGGRRAVPPRWVTDDKVNARRAWAMFSRNVVA
jgi:hypothetical protein